jgi:hypothetical protein
LCSFGIDGERDGERRGRRHGVARCCLAFQLTVANEMPAFIANE